MCDQYVSFMLWQSKFQAFSPFCLWGNFSRLQFFHMPCKKNFLNKLFVSRGTCTHTLRGIHMYLTERDSSHIYFWQYFDIHISKRCTEKDFWPTSLTFVIERKHAMDCSGKEFLYNSWPKPTITEPSTAPPIRDKIKMTWRRALVGGPKNTQHHCLFTIETNVSN